MPDGMTEAQAPKPRRIVIKRASAEESKRDKFVRLAGKRVPVAIKAIQLIGNLSSRNTYEFTDKDIAKIKDALQEAVNEAIAAFHPQAKPQKKGFSL